MVNDYFAALSRRDVEAMAGYWAPDGQEHIASQVDAVGPQGVREYFTELFTAFPDFALTVQTTVAEGDKVAVHWKASATMTGPLWSLEPTGAHIDLEGIDLLTVADGLIVRNDAVPDGMALARQLGLVPEAGSALEQRMFAAFNVGTKATRRMAAKSELERVADGVWLLRGGVPRTMNVYFLEDEGGGVTLFDAGIGQMTGAVATAAAPLGGINRVVLGHADVDHRGAAAGLGVPVFCHPADRAAAEEGRAAARLPPHRAPEDPVALGLPAAARVLEQRAGRDRRHRRRGRRRVGLPRRASPGPRARPDRAVPRARPARADDRLLLHDRRRHVATAGARSAPSTRSTRTPRRHASRSASSRRSTPRPAGPATSAR